MSGEIIEWNNFRKNLEGLTQDEKLQLLELVVRSLRAPTTAAEPEDHRVNLARLLRELDALPVQNPDDGFSSRDHDDELYREPR